MEASSFHWDYREAVLTKLVSAVVFLLLVYLVLKEIITSIPFNLAGIRNTPYVRRDLFTEIIQELL